MKFKNGRDIKDGDLVFGTDWRNLPVQGTAVTGDKSKGHDEFVFQHGIHKTACPSLPLNTFLHLDDAVKAGLVKTPPADAAKPGPAIAGA